MSCFCIANIDLLASLNGPNLGLPDLAASGQASLTLSPSAQAALALYGQIALGLPGLAAPALPAPQLTLSADALASMAAMAQLQAQAMARLGIDLSTSMGATALARLTATLDARMSAIADLNLNLNPWIQLASVNAIALDLTAMFNACLGGSASAAFNLAMPPMSWGGLNLPSISALLALAAQLNVSLDAAFATSLQASASALASAMANISLDVSAAASLAAGFSAIAQLAASLGINPLEVGFPSVRAMVAANFSAMTSLAAQLGIDLALGIPGLPALPSIPGLSAALSASLAAQLQAAIEASASLNTIASFDVSMPISAMLAASLALSLSAALGTDVALPAPCGQCDLRSIMAAVADAPSLDTPAMPSAPNGSSSAAPSSPNTPAAPSNPAGPPGAPGAPSGGGGAAGGGGGVQATIMSAQLMCTMGMAPSVLSVLPVNRTTINGQFAANIMDHVPMVNIMPFGMCISPANPTVAAATAAALGVLTPMPCIPATSSPWVPGAPTVLLGNQPMLDSTSKCMCNWAGVISIAFPGQLQTTIP
jgi:hypothetical protein